MRRLLSKESLADFAQQAAGALRRMVSSSDGWNSRDALSSSSQIVVAACRTNTKLDTPTLDAWVDDLVRELEMQSANAGAAPAAKESTAETATAVPAAASSSAGPSLPSDKTRNDAWKPLSESALMANLEVARVLMCSVNAGEAAAAYHAKRLVFALVQFYQCPTLSQKLRDCCALVVVGVCSSHSPLLRDCLLACQDTLRAAATDSTGRVLRVLLASLLVEVLHQFHILGHGDGAKEELGDRGTAYLKLLMDCLFQAACQVLQEPSPVPTSGVMSPMTVALGKVEGDAAGKAAAAAAASFPTERSSPSTLSSAPAPPPPPPSSTPAASPNAPSAASTSASASAVAVVSDAAAAPAEAVSAEAAASTPPASTAATSASACNNTLTLTTSVVLLSVVAGVYRGRADLKSYFVHTYGADYARLWVKLASQLPQMQTTLQLTAASSRTTVTATLEPVEYWRSELLEMLVEVCTEKSFTNQRAIVMMTLTAAGNGSGSGGNTAAAAAASAGASARRVAQRVTGSGPAAVLGGYQYDPIPPDWEVHLASGSATVWQLASALYSCTVTAAGADLLTAVLLQLNTKYASAETLYRWTITTLTLLCVANPRNAVVLSEHGMLRTLVALINCNQPSVFPSSAEVTLWSCADGGDAHHTPAEANAATAEPAALPRAVTQCLTPAQTLNVNTTQLTFCLLDTLTSTTFSKTAVAMLRKGIQDMYSVASSQTDVDVVENVLHGLGKAFIPHPILFFPGDGYVTRRLRQIFPRGSGYSFSAWIYPTCVWGGGSCLYSFMDQSDTRVSILVVADGRLCSLAVRVNKSGSDPLELVMGDGTFAASQWTHVVVTHGVALNVHVNGRKLESVHDVPYPKEKHSLTFTMGGAAQLPGFVGYTSGMSVSPSLSERDIARLCAAGPTLYEPTKDCAALLAPCFEEESGSENPSTASGSTLQRHEVMAKHPAEFTWHNVELHTPTDIEEVILPRCVIEWVLTVLQAREKAAVQSISTAMNVSKLCISFLSTSMQLASSEELTTVVRKKHLERLRREVLSWKTTFPEFASLLLQSVAVRGGGRVLRQHACTQSVFDILLSCVMQTSARNKELMEGSAGMSDGSAPQSSPTGASSPQVPAFPPPQAMGGTQSPLSSASPLPSIDTHQANATNIILRELSDCLLVKENLGQFQEDPRRFQKILNSTLYLPNECIKSVVILIEKLCRGEAELRQVFLFLFTPSSLSPTADTAKVRVLRMLFDIAQEDVAMCEMIQECCKGRGFAFLLLLVNGENHCSEAIRVLAVGLLSLLLPLKSCAKFFKKNDGFDILSMAITEPRSPIPLGIRTFDALIQVAFDEFRRRKEKKPEADSIAMRLMAAAHLAHRSRQRDSTATTPTPAAASVAAGSAAGAGRPARRTFEYRGYTPSIAVNQLGTRRGYSFEHTHDYGRVSEDFGELMILHKGSRYHSLELPLALKTVMCALDALIHTLVCRLPAASPGSNASNSKRVPSGEPPFMSSMPMAGGAGVSDYPTSPLPRQESGQLLVTGGGGAAASPSNSDERVVVEVLNYLSKVIDYPKHALKLMDIQWLGGLWQAVRVFFERPPDVSATSAASASPAAAVSGTVAAMERELYEVGVRRLHQDRSDFVAEVRQRTCTIIRKMVILDISSNERAQVRSIRDGDYPPRLVRIVLEEIARYFCVQKNGELTENASNIIRNLNSIFKEVQTALHPFPPSLGVAIVMAITNISVSSSMQVRRRMKTSSNLLTMRDNLAFFVLRESRRFLRLRKRSLNQLVDINVNNANSMTVLLFHLSNSITENNVNEVEILVPLIQQLAGADSARLRELHSVVGEHRDVIELKDLLSSSSSNGIGGGGVLSPLQPSAYSSIPTPSDRAMSEAFTDVDSNAGGAAGGNGNGDRPHWNGGHGLGLNPLEDDTEPSPGAFTVQLLEWCRAKPEAWATVQRNVQAAMANLALDKRDEKKEERSTFFGVSSGGPQTPKAGSGSGGGGSGSTSVGGGGGSSSGGAAGVGYSERSRREFQQLRVEVEEEVARSTGASAALATPSGSVGH